MQKSGLESDMDVKVNGQVDVDRGRRVWELIGRRMWNMQQTCGVQKDIVRARSWSWHR